MRALLAAILLLVVFAATFAGPPADRGNSASAGNGNGGGNDNKGGKKDEETIPAAEVVDADSAANETEAGNRGKGKGSGKERKNPRDNGPPKGKKYSKEERTKLRQTCATKKGPGGCRGQSAKSQARKAKVYDLRVQHGLKRASRNKNLTAEERNEIEGKVGRQMSKTFDAKQAFLRLQGLDVPEDDLTEIVADDDGVWSGDMFLTEEQADRLAAAFERRANGTDPEYTGDQLPPPPLPGMADDSNARKKRYALFLEENLGAKWDEMPIKFMFDDYIPFSDTEKAKVLRGLEDIEMKTCIKFEEMVTPDYSVPYILYMKEDYEDFCGLSYLGRTDFENPIWLNFGNDSCVSQMVGTVIHDTLHVLGIEHTQARYDRNLYLYIDFDNVDPQALDLFAEADSNSFNSYGVQYSYFSVMHFGAYSGALDPSKYVMYAAIEPRTTFNKIMGQRIALGENDAAMLRKMYCTPADCADTHAWCGWWATVGYCLSNGQQMLDLCPKSCSFCPYEAYQRALVSGPNENQPPPT